MARPPHLAAAVAALAALVVLLRSLHAFEALNDPLDLQTLAYASRFAWSVAAVAGSAAVGYAYAVRSADGPRRILAVALLAALVGVLAGYVLLWLATDTTFGRGLASGLALAGGYAVVDAAMLAVLTLGGYALGSDGVTRATP